MTKSMHRYGRDDGEFARQSSRLCFRAYGVALEVRTNRARTLESLIKLLPPGWKPTTGRVEAVFALRYSPKNSPRYSLFRNEEPVGESELLSDVLDVFESNVHRYVAEWSPRRIFVHAGVVVWRGRAIVIPGTSFSGKTTLVRELLRAGAAFYSDEYAVLDDRGRVYPFARPLAVRETGGEIQTRMRPEAFGARVGRGPAPVGLIVMSRYRSGARFSPRLLSSGRSALEVLSHTVCARSRPDQALSVIGRLVSEAATIKSARGEADATARAVLDYLDEEKPRNSRK